MAWREGETVLLSQVLRVLILDLARKENLKRIFKNMFKFFRLGVTY